MADAIVSIALQKLADILEKQVKEEINLVRGVKNEITSLSSELTTIRNVLDDAERRWYKEKSIQRWLKKLEATSYDIDDVLDEWNFAILRLRIEQSNNGGVMDWKKVCSLIPCSCLCFKKVVTRHDIAKKIKGLKQSLDVIVNEKDRYDFVVNHPVDRRESDRIRSTSSLDVSEVHGREGEKDFILSKLMTEEGLDPRVVSIVGTGGIGKTTLAQLVYNDDSVKNGFELRIWICVSDVFDEVRIARGIVEIVRGSSPDVNELESLLKCVTDLVSGKRFLLVLDDVWTEDYNKWEPLKNCLNFGGQGSKILVTTRSERVARMMGSSEIHRLGHLSDENCWLLMRRIAFFGRNNEGNIEELLQEIGKKIAGKCKGLPLAAKFLGSLLRFKDNVEEWENVLNSEIWEMEEAQVELFPHLLLSYNELSPMMKRCFSYCAVFPKDTEMDVEKLIRMWMAQGYLSSNGREGDLELKGKEYFDNLRMHSFFLDYDGYRCKMHDVVHDFAQFLRKTNITDVSSEASEKGSLASEIKVYRSLLHHKELIPLDTCDCTACLRVLSLCDCKLQEIPTYVEDLIHLRYLDLTDNKLMVRVPKTIFKLYNLETLYLANCGLENIPAEIRNLINLRHLDLYSNPDLKELPKNICDLHDLRTLNLDYCGRLCRLPEGIHRLVNLIHLPNKCTYDLHEFPQGLETLTGLKTLTHFFAGRGWSKLGFLKKLDQLSGTLELKISLHDKEDVVEAVKAELRNKTKLQCLKIWFFNEMERSVEQELVKNEALEALETPINLQRLTIVDFQGTKFPGWITSPFNNLKVLEIQECNYCSTLPALGKLPSLEELSVWRMSGFECLDREFLGISTPFPETVISFPKLIKLKFWNCPCWKTWEDLTDDQEEDGANLSIFSCLKELKIDACGLTELPIRLLRKANLLESLEILDCRYLSERYEDKEHLLSHIPHVTVNYDARRAGYRSQESPLPGFYG